MPLSGMVCLQWAETNYDQTVYQIWNLYVLHPLQRYGKRRKMQKLGWFGGH